MILIENQEVRLGGTGMQKSKLPVRLIWQLFGKIFDDLDIEQLQKSLFKSSIEPSNNYELLYGLILRLLWETSAIIKDRVPGVSDDLFGMDIDKTISMNTLRECKVYSTVYDYTWLCLEHKVFIKVLKICEQYSDSRFINQRVFRDFLSKLQYEKKFSYKFADITTNRALNTLLKHYDSVNDTLYISSILNRNKSVYLSLCRFAYIVLISESQNTDLDGSYNLNYSKLDYYIIQQYGVKEVWNVINNIRSLRGKKHRNFQPTIFSGNCSSLKPDAVYIFDNCAVEDTIVVVKLYGASCLDSEGRNRFSNVVNQLVTYKMMYPDYIKDYKEKCSRKTIMYKDVNVWALHFRRDITNEEIRFRGTRLDVMNIGVYVVDMFEGCNVSDLDSQLYEFVHKYILNS